MNFFLLPQPLTLAQESASRMQKSLHILICHGRFVD
jgi:hypothetical protein